MSEDFIVVHTLVYHGKPKPAKHVTDGDNILFGGKVWIVEDANFKDEAQYPNDLEIKLVQLVESVDGQIQQFRQTIIVDREFEVFPLVIRVLAKEPRTAKAEVSDSAQG